MAKFKLSALKSLATLLLFLVWALPLQAEDSYYVGKDEGGVYLHTNGQGEWYIDQADLKRFKIGQTGIYRTGADRYGTYLLIDRSRKFYIDVDASRKIDRQIENFNRSQDKSANNKETKVIVKGDQVLVPVTLGYGSRQTEVCCFWIGVSIITLHQTVAEKLNVNKTQKAVLTLAGGQKMESAVAKLSYVRVGPIAKKNMDVGFIVHKGPENGFVPGASRYEFSKGSGVSDQILKTRSSDGKRTRRPLKMISRLIAYTGRRSSRMLTRFFNWPPLPAAYSP